MIIVLARNVQEEIAMIERITILEGGGGKMDKTTYLTTKKRVASVIRMVTNDIFLKNSIYFLLSFGPDLECFDIDTSDVSYNTISNRSFNVLHRMISYIISLLTPKNT